jgi:hypothetical protein
MREPCNVASQVLKIFHDREYQKLYHSAETDRSLLILFLNSFFHTVFKDDVSLSECVLCMCVCLVELSYKVMKGTEYFVSL